MERRNLREVAYCHKFIHINIVHCSYEHNVLSITMFIYSSSSSSSSSSSKFISNHTDIVIHMVIYSIILHIQNIWCDLGYTQ